MIEELTTDELLRRLQHLRGYVRHLWDEERRRTGRGSLPFDSYLRNVKGIEDGDGWPNKDGTIKRKHGITEGEVAARVTSVE